MFIFPEEGRIISRENEAVGGPARSHELSNTATFMMRARAGVEWVKGNAASADVTQSLGAHGFIYFPALSRNRLSAKDRGGVGFGASPPLFDEHRPRGGGIVNRLSRAFYLFACFNCKMKPSLTFGLSSLKAGGRVP